KGLVIYELFAQVAEKAQPVTEQELKNAYELLSEEVHCRMIAVREKSTSQQLYQELCQGANFETLAVRYSIHPSRTKGGDLGYIPEYYIEEPLRSAVVGLKPGEFTKPIFFDSSYQIVLLIDRRPTSPPLPPFLEAKQQLSEQIKLWRRRRAANEYVQNLRERLVYNPAGLAIFYKPVDSITEEEKEIWVAIRDQKKYVKVGRLLHIARRFPLGLDTAIRTYAIKRAIEDDLMFEDGLNLGLDKAPKVKEQLKRLRRKLLYETLFNRLVVEQAVVTDSECFAYYQNHRERYPKEEYAAVAPLIRNHLLLERQKMRQNEILTELRSRAKITINQKVLKRVLTNLSKKRS
ncbi:MAG: peptidylprolyl isomerase, partial [candidate division WOR-3 bacterium]